MAHTTHSKKRLLTRVRKIKGQSEALERHLEKDMDCAAILQQIAAIRGAVNGLMLEVLEGHIREHLLEEDVPIKQRREDVEQVVSVLKSYLK